jgi:hypothetical protein
MGSKQSASLAACLYHATRCSTTPRAAPPLGWLPSRDQTLKTTLNYRYDSHSYRGMGLGRPPARNKPKKLWDESTGKAGGVKRTSKGPFDPAAKKHGPEKTWIVQDILSERMQKKSDGSEGMWPHYRVKWQSVATGPDAGNWSDDQHDTHEPLDYLPGCEDMINAMQRARDGANAAMDAAEAERREEKKRKRAAAASAPAGEGSEEPGEDPDHLLPLRAKNGLVRGVWCVVRARCVVCGARCVVFGARCVVWCVVCGVRCVVCGVWCAVCGVRCVVRGVWCAVCGVRCVVCGARCVVCGVWCAVCGARCGARGTGPGLRGTAGYRYCID